jgi:predicted dehydrogenase
MALIGHGHLGKWHAQKISDSDFAELDTIVEANKDAHADLQKTYPNAKIVDNFDDVAGDVQGCVISTPTSTHYKLSSAALEKGLHVFCEKPICDSLEKALNTKEALVSQEKDLVFQVGHSERVHACWENKELINRMKSAKSIEITRVAPFKGRATDVSVIQDLMIHDIDLLLYKFNFKVINVRAVGKKVLSNQYDYVTVHFEGEDERIAQITASRVDPKEVREIRFGHNDGVTSIDLMNRKINSFHDGKLQDEIEYEKRDHLAIEQAHFYQSIQDTEANPIFCTIDEAINVQEVMEEIEEVLQGLE